MHLKGEPLSPLCTNETLISSTTAEVHGVATHPETEKCSRFSLTRTPVSTIMLKLFCSLTCGDNNRTLASRKLTAVSTALA
jgi:hypothetical protein